MEIRSAINYGEGAERRTLEGGITDKDRKKPIKFGRNLRRSRLRKSDKTRKLCRISIAFGPIKSHDVIQK